MTNSRNHEWFFGSRRRSKSNSAKSASFTQERKAGPAHGGIKRPDEQKPEVALQSRVNEFGLWLLVAGR